MKLVLAIENLLIATRANGRSVITVDSYAERLSHLLDFLGDVEVEDITVNDLRRYINAQFDQDVRYADHHRIAPQPGGLSPFTIAGRVRAMKRLFNFLVEERILEHTPAEDIKTPNPKRIEPKGITRKDLLALIRTTEEEDTLTSIRDRAIILFLADTGCRLGGLCGLRLKDLDLEHCMASVTEKGEKTRLAPFTEITAQALREWLNARADAVATWRAKNPDTAPENLDAVFLSLGRWGHRIKALAHSGVARMLKRRAERGGCTGPVNPHAFRHAFARDFLMDGGDLGTLADLMGHSSVLVTKDFYGIFTAEQLREKHGQHSPIAQIYNKDEKEL